VAKQNNPLFLAVGEQVAGLSLALGARPAQSDGREEVHENATFPPDAVRPTERFLGARNRSSRGPTH